MYGKLVNKELIYAPINYNTGSQVVLNFNKNVTLMKQHGFKLVIDNKPNYNETTHSLVITGYAETNDSITINYRVDAIPQNPTLEGRVAQLEKVVKDKLSNTVKYKIVQ